MLETPLRYRRISVVFVGVVCSVSSVPRGPIRSLWLKFFFASGVFFFPSFFFFSTPSMAMELTGDALVADLRERLAAAEAEVRMLGRIRVRRDAAAAAALREAEDRVAAAEARAEAAEGRAFDEGLRAIVAEIDASTAERERLRRVLWPHWLRRNRQLQRLEDSVAAADVRLAALEAAFASGGSLAAPPTPLPAPPPAAADEAAPLVAAEPPRTRRRQT